MENEFKEFLDKLTDSVESVDLALMALQADIAAAITSKRLDLNMSQSDFASFMGVSQGLVSRWEKGETNFTLKTIVDLASKLNIKLQSPFVLNRPHYHRYMPGSNITAFPKEYRTAGVSPRSSYESLELKEN